jgi:hypothetical protein
VPFFDFGTREFTDFGTPLPKTLCPGTIELETVYDEYQ